MISFPAAFESRMRVQLGEEADAFFASFHITPPTSIRLNHLKSSSSFDLLDNVPWCDDAFYLKSRPYFHLDPHWHGGAYYVQEASSMVLDYVIRQLRLEKKPRIWLDLCAAPGGKTGILARHLHPTDVLIANEVVPQRRNILRENLVKAGYLNTVITGEQPSAFNEPLVDVMLIDAPCAGEGMMRKDAEAVNQWNPSLVQSCATLQRDIVRDSVKSLLPDGYLIYSTCSYSMDENIRNVSHYLKTHQLRSVQIPFPENWGIKTIENNDTIGYQLYPHRISGEGLFIAVLQNISPDHSNSSKPKKPFHWFENIPEAIAQHLSTPESFMVRKNSKSNELITKKAEVNANEVIRLFPRAEFITQVGEMKGKDFVPSHPLAMAGIQHESYEILDLSLDESLDYLERATHSLPARNQTGWYLIRYDETILGWTKRTGQGWKNHYPMNWRLRDRRVKNKD